MLPPDLNHEISKTVMMLTLIEIEYVNGMSVIKYNLCETYRILISTYICSGTYLISAF